MPADRTTLAAAAAALVATAAFAQQGPVIGMRPSDPAMYAITNAKVIVAPGTTLEKATIVIANGVIQSIGPDVAVPAGYRVIDGTGKTVLPAFIECALSLDSTAQAAAATAAPGAHWNQYVTPEARASDIAVPDATLDALRAQGFAIARVLPGAGIFRGTSDTRLLARPSEKVTARELNGTTVQVVGPRSIDWTAIFGQQTPGTPPSPATMRAFERENRFPSSLMGSYALMRQTFIDANWRAQCLSVQGSPLPPEDMNALDALQPLVTGAHGVLLDASDELETVRLIRLARTEMPKAAVSVLGNGFEFRAQAEILELLGSSSGTVIVPIDFPQAPDLVSPTAADTISLRDLMTWRHAPTNPKRLVAAGATIALTTHRMQDKGGFRRKLADAIAHGLTKDEALAALTTAPARMLGIDARVGTLETSKMANLLIAAGDPFEADTKFEGVFVAGSPVVLPPDAPILAAGVFTVAANDATPKAIAKELAIALDPKDGSLKATWTEVSTEESKSAESKSEAPKTEAPKSDEPKPDAPAADAPKSEPAADAPREGRRGGGRRGERGADVAADASADPSKKSAVARRASVADGRASGVFEGAPFGFDGDVRVAIAGARDGATMVVEDATGLRASFTLTRRIEAAKDDKNTQGDAKQAEKNEGDTQPAAPKSDDPQANDAKPADGAAAQPKADAAATPDAKKPDDRATLWQQPLGFPLGEYGRASRPAGGTVLIKNATIWTLGAQGTMKDADMLVRDGKIVEVADEIAAPEVEFVIDARGMHVTPGLIDCHSHTGISGGVNEGSQSCTAEVWIGDVIDPTDIDWYRQLAGGLTAVNQLHGSANPIGGRNSVVKIRWGEGAEAFRFEGAPSGIKFALGENVVRSKSRYPSSRMGVATFIEDSFLAAREYRAKQAAFRALDAAAAARAMPPRPDLELETLAEILEGTRLVHCHSYRQDEILMLLRTAEKFGFRVATLQHVLEGYKVAGEIAAHGAGPSSFSDWWAYKVEVMDAIPWNGAILHKAGAVVSFNSDSDELARRMNMEAAKAVRYGNLSPEEALKLVTLNPAKQLRIDHRVGSLEAGKDADFALWNGDPLSAFTRCEETWVDGVRRYARTEEAGMAAETVRMRADLVAKAVAAGDAPRGGPGAGAGGGAPGDGRGRRGGRAPTLLERMLEAREDYIWLRIARGQDPFPTKQGDCGCGVIGSGDTAMPASLESTIGTN
ncbi:MAG: amidohydrolase family protein [Planctomycetota bacterium]